jgi:hypothetical protein
MQCMQAEGPNFEIPTDCSQGAGGRWYASFSGGGVPGAGGSGIPGAVVGIGLIVLFLGVGLTVWRVSLARRIAKDAGMNPNAATAVTLLGSPGLDAAYVASAVHQRSSAPASQPPASATPAAPRTAEERLMELEHLREQGLLSDAEYAERRQVVLDLL